MNELLVNYPKSASVIRAYFMELFLETSKGLPDDFKEYARQAGMKDDNILLTMERSPSLIFRVLDTKDVFVSIMALKNCYVHKVSDGVNDFTSSCFDTRLEAEKDAVAKGMEMMEAVLPEANEVG